MFSPKCVPNDPLGVASTLVSQSLAVQRISVSVNYGPLTIPSSALSHYPPPPLTTTTTTYPLPRAPNQLLLSRNNCTW